MSRFKLEKSKERQGWWVLTDTANLVVIQFKEHEYNETQKVSPIEDSLIMSSPDPAAELARILREMGEYMFAHWYSIAMPVPVFEFRQDDENDRTLVLRNKFPKLSIEVQDDCSAKQLSDALKASGEFVIKSKNKDR